MRGTLSDPGFPAVAAQLGLMKYWKTTHTRPDVCKKGRAAFLPNDLTIIDVGQYPQMVESED